MSIERQTARHVSVQPAVHRWPSELLDRKRELGEKNPRRRRVLKVVVGGRGTTQHVVYHDTLIGIVVAKLFDDVRRSSGSPTRLTTGDDFLLLLGLSIKSKDLISR